MRTNPLAAKAVTESPPPPDSGNLMEDRATEFLAFALGSDGYAVRLDRVREIVNPPQITPVPRGPKHILGVCSVRGSLVTVVDLRRRLRLPADYRPRSARVLLTHSEQGEGVGLYVDEVKRVVRLARDQIEVASVVGSDLSEHVLGIGRPTPDDIYVLLDLSTISA